MGERTETETETGRVLTAARVEELVKDCLFKDEEWSGEKSKEAAPDGAVFAEGLLHTFVFHPGRLAEHRAEIGALLAELPDDFQIKGGGGWTFLNACMDRHGNHWAEHPTIEALICLGIATKQARWILKEIMAALPGGVPYFSVGERAQ